MNWTIVMMLAFALAAACPVAVADEGGNTGHAPCDTDIDIGCDYNDENCSIYANFEDTVPPLGVHCLP